MTCEPCHQYAREKGTSKAVFYYKNIVRKDCTVVLRHGWVIRMVRRDNNILLTAER